MYISIQKCTEINFQTPHWEHWSFLIRGSAQIEGFHHLSDLYFLTWIFQSCVTNNAILYAPDVVRHIKTSWVNVCSARQGLIPQVSTGRRDCPQWMVFSKFFLAEGSLQLPPKLKVRFWTLAFLEPKRARPIHHCVCDRDAWIVSQDV